MFSKICVAKKYLTKMFDSNEVGLRVLNERLNSKSTLAYSNMCHIAPHALICFTFLYLALLYFALLYLVLLCCEFCDFLMAD
jgi:hypothetical protein